MPYPLIVFTLLIHTISVFNISVTLTVPDFTWLQIILGQWLDDDNQLKKLLLSRVSFLTCLNIQIGKKRFTFMRNFLSVSMILFLQRQNLRFTARRILLFFQLWEWRDWWMTREWSFGPVKPPFWLDIVRWPPVILSSAFTFNLLFNDYMYMHIHL